MTALKLGFVFALAAVSACQFEDRCGKDDLAYDRGLCSARAVDAGTPAPVVDAGAGEEGGALPSKCTGSCDLIGRCLAENTVVSGGLADQLMMLGFVGADRTGCVTYCDAHSAGAGDDEVLACLKTAEEGAVCDTSMLVGALPSVQGMDECCKGHADSEWCVAVCTALSSNPMAYGLVASCKDIAP